MQILGLVTRTHDSGLALLEDGVPTLVLEEERFNREKHTRKFPFRSLKAAFDDRGSPTSRLQVGSAGWVKRVQGGSATVDHTIPLASDPWDLGQ